MSITARTSTRPPRASPSSRKLQSKNRRASPGDGACAFPSDPKADARQSPALWSPETAPDVVIVEAADPARAIPLPRASEPLVEVSTAAERNLVVAIGVARLRLCIRHATRCTVPTLAIPCDAACTLRLAAAARFQRVTQGRLLPIDRSALPSPYQRRRFTQLLTLHDALEAGASTRDLAFGLVLPNHRPLAGALWKGSSERRHVLRLISDARRLVAGGYRALLLHH